MPALRFPVLPLTLLLATTAAAQGPPPFELEGDARRSVQVVRMQLGLNDPEEGSADFSDMTADAPFQATLNRTTLGNGVTGTGRLSMFPLGIAFGGPFGVTQPQGSGASPFLVLEFPSVTGGFYAPYVEVGTYDWDITCSSVVCGRR